MEIHTCQKSGLQHGGWLSWEKTTMFSVLFTPSTSNSLQFGFYAHGLSVYMIIKGGAIFFDSYFPPRAKAKADFFFSSPFPGGKIWFLSPPFHWSPLP